MSPFVVTVDVDSVTIGSAIAKMLIKEPPATRNNLWRMLL